MTIIKTIRISIYLLALQISASACNVPVFRYALERWPISPYNAVVIADEPLTAEEQRAMSQLEKACDGTSGALNLIVSQWTSEELASSVLAEKLPESKKGGARMHLLFPISTDVLEPIWSGALTGESVNKMIGSPVRQALVDKIVEGNSGVFILLESGNKAKDDEAAKELEASMAGLADEFSLPDGIIEANGGVTGGGPASFDPADQLRSSIPLKVAFVSMRVARTGADDILIAQLLGLQEGAAASSDQPMVFAVYGRGRALPPLIGEEISTDLIYQISDFLVGACSCQVKSLNPGTDLLLDHDWDRSVFGWE